MADYYLPNIPVALERVRPHGDFVLVKRLKDKETTEGGLIWISQYHRDPKKLQARRGLVIAAGAGDRLFPVICSTECWTTNGPQQRTDQARSFRCRFCGSQLEFLRNPQTDEIIVWRCEMHVKLGDHIVYWRSPANEVRIDGEEYTFLHEEQHIDAVIDQQMDVRPQPLPSRREERMIVPASELLGKLA